jgi:hypothetical protein
MTSIKEYVSLETSIIEIKKSGYRYLFLFFIYAVQGQQKWRLTSQIKRIRITKEKAIFIKKNSRYHLNTTQINYEKLSIETFRYCKLGHTPVEARILVGEKNIRAAITNNRLSGAEPDKKLVEILYKSLHNKSISVDKVIQEFLKK